MSLCSHRLHPKPITKPGENWGAHRKKVTLSKLLFRNVQITVTEVFRQPSAAGEVPPLGSLPGHLALRPVGKFCEGRRCLWVKYRGLQRKPELCSHSSSPASEASRVVLSSSGNAATYSVTFKQAPEDQQSRCHSSLQLVPVVRSELLAKP